MSGKDDKPNEVRETAKSVGYGTPPEATRFKKGISGNPRGRPKGSLNVASVFTRTLRERVVINEHGQRKTVTKLEAALKQLVNKAASGEMPALRQLIELSRDAEAKQNQTSEQSSVLMEVDQEVMDGLLKRFSRVNEDQGTSEECNGNDEQK
jgi:hypothetical protein